MRPCGWLSGTTLWVATVRDRCGGPLRPQGRLSLGCTLSLEGAVGVWVSQGDDGRRSSRVIVYPDRLASASSLVGEVCSFLVLK